MSMSHQLMAFRPYDLCLACATHAFTGGGWPLKAHIDNAGAELMQTAEA